MAQAQDTSVTTDDVTATIDPGAVGAAHWRTGRWLKFVVHAQQLPASGADADAAAGADSADLDPAPAPDPLETSDYSGSVKDKAKVAAARLRARARAAAGRAKRRAAAGAVASAVQDKPVAVFRSAALARAVVAEVNAAHSPFPWSVDAADSSSSASVSASATPPA